MSAIVASVLAVPAFFIRGKPRTPPSLAASMEPEPFSYGLRKIVKNRNFWILWIAFSTFVGFFNAFTTVLNSILRPYGYSDDDTGENSSIRKDVSNNSPAKLMNCTGTVGAGLILTGLVGAAVMGPIIDKTKAHKLVVKTICPIVGIVYFCFQFVGENN
jgi:hypothetical protein